MLRIRKLGGPDPDNLIDVTEWIMLAELFAVGCEVCVVLKPHHP
jgi:hypothetical protein